MRGKEDINVVEKKTWENVIGGWESLKVFFGGKSQGFYEKHVSYSCIFTRGPLWLASILIKNCAKVFFFKIVWMSVLFIFLTKKFHKIHSSNQNNLLKVYTFGYHD